MKKIILDECLPRKLKQDIIGHKVTTVPEMGWAGTQNGQLLRLIEQKGFDVFLTVDRNLFFQHSKKKLKIAVIILSAPTNRYVDLRTLIPLIHHKLDPIKAGQIMQISKQ